MKLVVFGLAVSSSWGNGHATLWRGLIGALARQGHRVTFFERDVPWYAETRDLTALPEGAELVLYPDWDSVTARAQAEAAGADAVMVTSFCPDGPAASRLAWEASPGVTVFYDMDTPVTLARLESGEAVDFLPPEGLGNFDLVLSYTGGMALDLLRSRLGARRVAPLYGHVDPRVHRPGRPDAAFRGDLSYLGTYAADRQAALEALFVEPARARPERRFVLAGAGYPPDFPWTDNIFFVKHLPPADHPAFFASSRLTLNVTRGAMAAMGWCPSGRLFEAAACGVPVLSDVWEGLGEFFVPGQEILTARTTADAVAALERGDADLARIGRAARERVLAEHSSDARAAELVALLGGSAPEGARIRGESVSCGE
ncbi:CgeB family protein [Rubellimicrobium aerolatum]|uniref:Glycosyltransferase n=1 Tax=Rubellimicrobium aerolatum TaxID=490979 RepID=A0ABW0S9D4_9RHOB|nr:glycosyltransferase [Rubellimicrobium aerolatum]MBP1804910.1 spore maturation protein CgeB [Rubellimicrobium aerolatum]